MYKVWKFQLLLIGSQYLAIVSPDLMDLGFRDGVNLVQVPIAPPLVLSEVLFGGVVTQNLSSSLPVYWNVGLTILTIKFVLVLTRVDRSRYKGSGPLHTFKVCLLHDLAWTGHLPSRPLSCSWLDETPTLITRAFVLVFYSFGLEGS